MLPEFQVVLKYCQAPSASVVESVIVPSDEVVLPLVSVN